MIVALDADSSARAATNQVREQLHVPDDWLMWSPYEEVLTSAVGPSGWREAFTRRYVDFTPVRRLLRAGDSRRRD